MHLDMELESGRPMTLRIGVIDQTAAGWSAGASFTRSVLRSLLAVAPGRAEISLLTRKGAQVESFGAQVLEVGEADLLPGERWVRQAVGGGSKRKPLPYEAQLRQRLGLFGRSNPFGVARREGIDVLLPAANLPHRRLGVSAITWFPDFQHVALPQFFSAEEIAARNEGLKRDATRANAVWLSSNAALADFKNHLPRLGSKGFAASFPSNLAFDTPGPHILGIAGKYNLPSKFALVVNQYWKHKNHLTVVRAVEILKQRGLSIPVAMTGMPADYRDPQNEVTSLLLQSIATAGLAGQVLPLGRVPWDDLLALMRSAALLIQPSLFEGWSTSIQDAKALGRPMVCSDIPVHREQAPGALGFFQPENPQALADLIRQSWGQLRPGPDANTESVGVHTELDRARAFGEVLLSECQRILRSSATPRFF